MRAYLIYMDGVYERGLSPTLVLDLDVVVVVFKLDDLYLILVSCPPHSLVVKNLDDLRNVIRRDDSYLLDSRNFESCLKCRTTGFQEMNTCKSFVRGVCVIS